MTASVAAVLATGIMLGCLHAFAPDHLATVGLFASRGSSTKRAARLAVTWGIGHSTPVVLVGGMVLLAGMHLPESLSSQVDVVVGISLAMLGMSSLARAYRGDPFAAGDERALAREGLPLMALGMLHGLAGTGAVALAAPSTAGASAALGLVYLLSFSIGTILGMSFFSMVLAPMTRAAPALAGGRYRFINIVAGLAALAVGAVWVATSL